MYGNIGLTKIKVKSESIENVKLAPEQIISLRVKASCLIQLKICGLQVT